ncbi:CHAP domain-containing protein [Staphylococcus epidermidis]|uniref:CHAP domain-containing protein n=1 Tax=Staphylococcus epidermidis TaxID=1282 RepID=UPI0021B26252|nr:CHAP domain-containing protein [Staphylococcus epidermidis]
MNEFDGCISGELGDGDNWNNGGESEGYRVRDRGKNDSAVVFEGGELGGDREYGHVGLVEKVNEEG